MTIKTWHWGKIVMLWAWGAAVIIIDLYMLKENMAALTKHVLLGFAVLTLLLIIPVSLSVLTWRWLSGKEAGANALTNQPKQSKSRHSGST
jgi:membrane protein YdbS with pleckstrin-like domain